MCPINTVMTFPRPNATPRSKLYILPDPGCFRQYRGNIFISEARRPSKVSLLKVCLCSDVIRLKSSAIYEQLFEPG